jgi:hypothetical protein
MIIDVTRLINAHLIAGCDGLAFFAVMILGGLFN